MDVSMNSTEVDNMDVSMDSAEVDNNFYGCEYE